MSSSSGEDEAEQDLHPDVIIVSSLFHDRNHAIQGSPKVIPWLLDSCLPSYSTKFDFEYGPGELVQGRNSRNAVRNLALKLLSQVQSLRKARTGLPPPIVWVGFELGGTIIKEAIAIAALDRDQYRDVVTSRSLFIFIDCIHRADTQSEIVNRITPRVLRATEMKFPVLLQSIDALGDSVAEINETFLETKLPMSMGIVSLRLSWVLPRTNLDKFNATLGILRERAIYIMDYNSQKRAKEVLEQEIAKAVADSKIHDGPWLEAFQLLSAPPSALFDRSSPRDGVLDWILADDVYTKWRQTKGPLALQLHGPKSSDALQIFCKNEASMIDSRQPLVVHFTFDCHDNRRHSGLMMATSLIAQIISFSKNTTLAAKLFSQRWLFRAWTLFDALHMLRRLTHGIEIDFIIEDFDQCDPTSRQQCLDMFKETILLRDSNIRLLVTSDKNLLAEWLAETFGPNQKSPTSPHQTLDRVLNLHVGEFSRVGASSSAKNDTTESNTAERNIAENCETPEPDRVKDQALEQCLKLRLIDAGVSEAGAQDLIHIVLSADDTVLRDVLLLQLRSQAPIPQVETVLSLAKSQSFHSMIKQVLEGVQESERHLARRVLSWLVYSVRPLTIQELGAVVLWTQQGQVLDSPTMKKGQKLRLVSPIMNILWGILLIDKNEVRLVHPAVREPLLDPGAEWFNIGQDAHLYIVLSCLDLLSQQEVLTWMEENKGSQCRLGDEDVPVSRSTFVDRTTLHHYIITNWPEHYLQIPASYRPKHEVVSFFEKDSGRVWRTWARARWIMSNPINRGARQETFSKGAMPFVAEIGDLELLKLWENVSGNQDPEDRGNALVEASRTGGREIVDHLLKDGYPGASQLQLALTAAASSAERDILMILIPAAPEGFAWPASLLVRVSELGFEDCVKGLLDRGCNPDIPVVSEPKTTALIEAAKIGNAQICDLLLQHNANPNDSNLQGETLATIAANCARGADVLKTLKAHKIDILAEDKYGDSALSESCQLGHFEVCRALVDVAKDSEKTPSFEEIEQWLQWTADDNFCLTAVPLLDLLRADSSSHILKRQLRNALELGRPQFVRLLIEECKDLLSPLEAADDELPWLTEVCNSPDADIDLMKLLVEAGAEVDPDTESTSPLNSAARKGRLEFVKFLIEHGAQINRNESVLSEAAHSGNLECVRYLLENGAELEWKDEYGETAIFEAAEGGHFDVVNFLLDQGVAVSGRGFEGRTLPILCISSANTLRRILERGSEIDTRDDSGWAPIHCAAAEGYHDAISVLSEFKAELNIETSRRPDDETTPLKIAVSNGHCESIRVLLEAGALVDYAVIRSRVTAILKAATPQVIDILLQYSPDVNAADWMGTTALHLRTDDKSPNIHVIKRLVNGRADVNVVCKEGCCLPLVNLARNANHWPIMEYLISKNADINMAAPQIGSALHRACILSDLQLVKLLLAAGAKADLGVSGYPGSPLQSACGSYADDAVVLAVMRYLIEEAQADVNQSCGIYGTAMNVACQRESSEALKLLFEHGAALDIRDQAGRLPVHLAALAVSDAFEQLVELQCDMHAVDNTGRTVLQWASQSGDVDIVNKILSYPDIQVDRPDKSGWTALCWASRGITSEKGRRHNRSLAAQEEVIKLLLERGADKLLQVPGDSDQTWTPMQIAIFHGSGEEVRRLLTETQEVTGANESKKRTSLRKGHRHGKTGNEFCNNCLSYLIGTKHACKSCKFFYHCFKCFTHRADIHDPTHEFELIGPTFDENDSLGDKESNGSESGESEASIALDLE